ncbi:hypothetical protein ACRB68_63970 [Actinomadura sp. RB68]|uniref:Uncharacterized protein n=1 Tax=Actinomadura macrotermitis TaxID=2585200 RepID=A0A7K0C4C0_9ACTN|nr:hypothetical protein [Actinomadura macrotermitis]
MDILKLLRDLGRALEARSPAALARQRERLARHIGGSR